MPSFIAVCIEKSCFEKLSKISFPLADTDFNVENLTYILQDECYNEKIKLWPVEAHSKETVIKILNSVNPDLKILYVRRES